MPPPTKPAVVTAADNSTSVAANDNSTSVAAADNGTSVTAADNSSSVTTVDIGRVSAADNSTNVTAADCRKIYRCRHDSATVTDKSGRYAADNGRFAADDTMNRNETYTLQTLALLLRPAWQRTHGR